MIILIGNKETHIGVKMTPPVILGSAARFSKTEASPHVYFLLYEHIHIIGAFS